MVMLMYSDAIIITSYIHVNNEKNNNWTLHFAVDKCTQFDGEDVRISGLDYWNSQLQEQSHLCRLLLRALT